jgi:hypothetical protein
MRGPQMNGVKIKNSGIRSASQLARGVAQHGMRHIGVLCIEIRAHIEIGAPALHNEADVAWRISAACRPAGG